MKKEIVFLSVLFFLNCTHSQYKDIDYVKKKETILEFYNKNKILYMQFNTQSNIVIVNTFHIKNEGFLDFLIPISKNIYFFPKEYKERYKYNGFFNVDNIGDKITTYNKNEDGLVSEIQTSFPDGNIEAIKFIYRNYQLLKIVEDKFIDKTILENKYDEKGRLISHNYGELKRDFFYNDKDQIVRENIKENNTNYTLLYNYNSKGELIKKYSEDRTRSTEYTYDEKGRLIKQLDYVASIEKESPNEVENNFTELIFEYDDEGNLIKEIKKHDNFGTFEYQYNKEKDNIEISTSIDEQITKALTQYNEINESGEVVVNEYKYYLNNLIKSDLTSYYYSNSPKDGKAFMEKIIRERKTTKYTYNTLGQIIKQEISDGDNKEPQEVKEFSY